MLLSQKPIYNLGNVLVVLGQHLNPLAGFHVRALQEDAAVMGSDQGLMGEVKNRMVG
jgi:hypothetical protein